MTSVQGIGGVFIYSTDAAKLAKWYETVLGVEMERHLDGDKYFKVFFTRDPETSVIRENPVFAIYQAYEALAQQGRGFLLNLRVADLSRCWRNSERKVLTLNLKPWSGHAANTPGSEMGTVIVLSFMKK